MEGKRKRTKIKTTSDSSPSESPQTEEGSENQSEQPNSFDNDNIPEATVIIEEIKSEENVTYKIMDENQGETGENATIIEMPSVETEKLVLQESRETEKMDAEDATEESAVSQLKIIDETVNDIVNEAEKKLETDEVVEPEAEKEVKGEAEEAIVVDEKQASTKSGGDETPRPKRSRRRPSHHGDITSPAAEDANKAFETPVSDASLARSRYGRVQKTKQPTPGMVTFDVPRRRASIKNGEKSTTPESKVMSDEANKTSTPSLSLESATSTEKEADTTLDSTPKAPPRSKSVEPRSSLKIKKLNKTESPRSIKKQIIPKAQKKSIVLSSGGASQQIYDREILTVIPEKEGEYMVGDLLWSKLPGYPWWPCMVSVDPVMGIYSKIGGTSYKAERVYHVQYFGTQPLRGYTMPGMIMPFNGRQEYELQLDRVKNSPVAQKSQRSKLLAKYTIKPQFKKEWDVAVDEAEMASRLPPEVRVRELTFEYINDNVGPSGKKRKIETSPGIPSKKVKKSSTPEDIYDFDDTIEDDTEETISPPLLLLSQSRANKKADFGVFLKKHRQETIDQNPHLTDVEIENLLRRKWDLMSKDLKAKYVVRAKMSTTPVPTKKTAKLKTPERRKVAVPSVPTPPEDEVMDHGSDDERALVIAEPVEKKKTSRASNVPRRQPKSETVTPMKSKESKLQSGSTRKVQKNGPVKLEDVPPKEVEIKPPEPVEPLAPAVSQAASCDSSDETATSEDASSTSEIEAGEALKSSAEVICATCHEEAVDFVRCTGPCLEAYHPKCSGRTDKDSSPFTCATCASGKFICYVCGSSSEDVKKCSDSGCGKFYHVTCLQKHYPFKKLKPDSEEFLCPLHFCLTCYVEHQDDRVYRSVKKRLVKCLKCPSAYHFLDHCIAAGSVTISNSYIICPEHQEAKRGRNDKHLNVTWCFSCNTGGSLICCERCPAAFHTNCLEGSAPESSFFCSDCVSRKQLHYGDIVWVKLGHYRWWPGRVCHPKNVPDNVMNLQHSIGEFPVYFFGSHDYFWIHKGRAFLFVEGDSTKTATHNGGSKSLTKSFKLAMQEAIEAYKLWQDAKKAVLNFKTSKPPPYMHIRSNKPVGKCQVVTNTDKSHNRCGCDPNSLYPCSSDVGCFNRLLMLECNPSICSAGEKCCNQRFRKREYVKAVPFKTPERGWGLKTLQDIKKQQFVIEYVGELIDEEECEHRLTKMVSNNESNFYFLTIDKDTIIDAGPKGNLARFMNHSCSPNCETQKWVVNGVTRVGLFALQDITAGSELTFNYNLDCRGNEKTVCGCGASNCSGFIGERPNKSQNEDAGKKLNNGNQKKRQKRRDRSLREEYDSLHDDDCFRCGEGGKLVMCDRKGCPKAFHLECLNLKDIPRGKWNCPWHHCDDCGKQSTSQCSYCPTSYCSEHCTTEKLKELPDGNFLCSEHINDNSDGLFEENPLSHEEAEPAYVGQKEPQPSTADPNETNPGADNGPDTVENGTNDVASNH